MKYVIIGVGAAGIMAAKTIRKADKESSLTMISLDAQVHSRCMLHKYLSHERNEKQLSFIPENFFEENQIIWNKAQSVKQLHVKEKQVELLDGTRVEYDKLLIATGANSFIPPVGNLREAKNVFGLRHLSDAQAIDQSAKEAENIVIIGSGLVGLDAAYGLMETGKNVSIVEMADRILPVQLDKTAAKELELLKRIKEHLEENKMAKSFTTDDEEEQEWLTSYNLLTYKPVIFAANVTEDDLANDGADNAGVQKVREYAAEENCEVFVVCAQIEQEIAELDEDEKKLFLDDLGLEESGLEKLIKASYHLLGLISYLTAGEQECRAWTITKGTKAPQAAGKIHTDFERGFIRAEVVSYDDLMACGTHAAAKEKGLVRLEGKEYVVQDGDIIVFRFNV